MELLEEELEAKLPLGEEREKEKVLLFIFIKGKARKNYLEARKYE